MEFDALFGQIEGLAHFLTFKNLFVKSFSESNGRLVEHFFTRFDANHVLCSALKEDLSDKL